MPSHAQLVINVVMMVCNVSKRNYFAMEFTTAMINQMRNNAVRIFVLNSLKNDSSLIDIATQLLII